MTEMPIRLKRIYEKPAPGDGVRILAERLWPRGLSKNDAKVDLWLKDAAPSGELRKWFDHDPSKWDEFKNRYYAELSKAKEAVEELLKTASQGSVTLVYASREEKYNNSRALKEYLEARFKSYPPD